MTFRTRILKLSLSVATAGALALGAPLAASAATLPTLDWNVTTTSNHTKLDVKAQVLDAARANYLEGSTHVKGYKHWRIQIIRTSDHKVERTITGNTYTALYIEWYLTDHKTGFPLTKFRTYTSLNNIFTKAHTLTQAQLAVFARTRY